MRAEPPCLPPAHRGANAVGLGLVAGGEHHASADDHRPAAQARIVPLLDRREERVEVGVEDRRPAVTRTHVRTARAASGRLECSPCPSGARSSSNAVAAPTRSGRGWTRTNRSTRADREAPLGADDLYLLATAAYMLARDDEYAASLERAHYAYASAGDTLRAVLCAFGVGLHLALRREVGGATGWFGRAQRLLDRAGEESVGHGYLLLPVMFQHEAAGDYAAAAAAAGAAAEIAQRFGDDDLFALSAQAQGSMLIKQGQVRQGLGLLDEAMVAVTSGELWPTDIRARLLRRHPGVPGGVRAPPGARVDCSSDALVRRAAGARRLHRPLPRAPRRDHAAGRRMVGGAGGGEAGGPSVRGRRRIRPPGSPTTARASSSASGASSTRPRRPTAKRAAAAGSRSRGWPSCGWRRGGRTWRPPRSAGRWARCRSR